MKRLILGLLGLALSGGLARADVMGRGPQALVMQDTTVVTATTNGTTTPQLGWMTGGICQLSVTAASGTTPTLDVKLQVVFPDGTVDDYAAFGQATAASNRVVSFNTQVASAAAHAPADGTLAAGTNGAGPFGDRLRVKAVVTGTTPSFTYKVTCRVAGQ